MAQALTVSQVSKTFRRGDSPALKDVSFELAPGRVMGVIGPNGAGKTTLLKVLATAITPDLGEFSVFGFFPQQAGNQVRACLGLATAEERSFYWRLSGRQNLELFAALHGLDKQTTAARIKELFATFQVNYGDKRFDSYSTGMKRAFAVMRALLHRPRLLLLDEPTRSLDQTTAAELRQRVILAASEQTAVLLATHHLEEAQDLCHEFLILDRGRVAAKGTLAQLRQQVQDPDGSLSDLYKTIVNRT